MATYLRNVWYVAGWEEEVQGSHWLVRRLLDVPQLIYRKQDNSGYVMLADRCPHRFAPLRLGTRQGDAVVCRYHGLAFGPDGACVSSLSNGLSPAHVHATCTPIVARHGLLWFWPGDFDAADPATIPDFSFLEGQNVWRRVSTFTGNYELVADNLMDLSHADHLHTSTFQTQGALARAVHEVFDGSDGSIWSQWKISDAPKPVFLASQFESIEKIDELLQMRWNAPASMVLKVIWMPHRARPEEAIVSVINPHIVTPETDHSSHYFWTCDPNAEAEALARAVFDTEDKPMIEAVQSNMNGEDFWQLKPAILKQDLGAIRARRRLIKLRHEEGALPKSKVGIPHSQY